MGAPLRPSVEQLISLANYGGKNRLMAAREVAHLSPDVDLEKLFWLIDILSSDIESPEFSELGISLGKLLEKMDYQRAMEFIEKLLETQHGRRLLTIILSTTKADIDSDVLSEVARRLLTDSDYEIRNGALGILRNLFNAIGKLETIDIVYELTLSDNSVIRSFVVTALLALSDLIDVKTIEDLILRLLDDQDPDVRKSVIEGFKVGLLDIVSKSKKMVWSIAQKIKSLDDPGLLRDFVSLLADDPRFKDIISYLQGD